MPRTICQMPGLAGKMVTARHAVQLIPEPYSTAVYVCVWTGLRVSEVLGLKWRCVRADSITIEEGSAGAKL